ncbi:MAG TPA: kinase to dihydroxyacetone kinase [Christensenellaceae bacterium]|jgi:dihydroxyacetone kinase-like predicted kinase|nr:kinase to dihydroxyacetone kinase [Christensenellaceae bacterium]
MLEYKFDVQLLIEGDNLDENAISRTISQIPGDCLLCVGDEEMLKVHYHTNDPWDVLKVCASFGDICDIVVENMQRQAEGLNG